MTVDSMGRSKRGGEMGRNGLRGLARVALATALLAVLLAVPLAVSADEADDVAAARAGTEAFTDVAAAEAAGYGLPPEGPLHECIASFDDTGAMGLHYINGDLVGDTALDPAAPEALVYEPGPNGALRLVALEYVVFAEAWDAENDHPPMLFDQMFMLIDEPNRYELPAFYALHAWLYKDNPAGTYEAFNPDVSCDPRLPDTATETVPAGPALPALPLVVVIVVGVMALIGIAFGRRRLT